MPPRRPRFRLPRAMLVALLLAGALSDTASADVIVVDQAGGGDFTSVAAAADAAQEGDIVLVRPGDYTGGLFVGSLFLGQRGLTIVADGGLVRVGSVRITSLPAGSNIVLRGLELDARLTPWPEALGATACLGQIWVEDCTLIAENGVDDAPGGAPGGPAVDAINSHEVVLSRCRLEGGRGADTQLPFGPATGPGGPGVRCTSASVQLFGCDVSGGDGGDFTIGGVGAGGRGGHGIEGDAATLLVTATAISGGDGGTGVGGAGVGPQGGDGLLLDGLPSVARLIDTTVVPGAGGFDDGGQGPPGVAIDAAGSTVLQSADTARLLELNAPVREGEASLLTYAGEQGDLFSIFYAATTTSFPLFGKNGTWMIPFPWVEIIGIGTVTDPGGSLVIGATVPAFPDPLLKGLVLYVQLFAQDTGGQTYVTSPSATILIDSGF